MVGVDEMSVQKLLQRFEHDIIGVNQKHISDVAGDIGSEELLQIGSKIASCRAQYLKLGLDMSRVDDSDISEAMIDQIRSQRMRYDELMLIFAALRHALKRGYIVVKESGEQTVK
ncbi:MAG: hypothetical protein ACI9V8_001915 [Urechidicola sp.]|jgi:hypothetical protein